MYAVYNYQAGSTSANVLADLIKLLTGETNKANLSANCVQANTSITASVAAGWTVHDASAGTNQQVIKALNQDGVSYKYYLLSVSSGTLIGGSMYEYWDSVTHSGTFGISGGTTAWDSSGGGYFYIYATAKNIIIYPWTAGGYQAPNGITVMEVSPDNVPTASFVADAQTLTTRAMPSSQRWSGMAYGNSTFVAVAGGLAGSQTTIAATSPDGSTWTTRTLPATAPWMSVAYGNSTFVAIAGGNLASTAAATSADGITWTSRTLPASTRWSKVIYAGGQFVAVAGHPDGSTKTTIAATSPDGITWTQRTLPVSTYWADITYGGGTYVAVGGDSTGSYAATSSDGITWTQRTMPTLTNQFWTGVAYGNSKFVAVSGYSNTSTVSATSPDGITWTQQVIPTLYYSAITCTPNGIFVAIGQNGTSICYSSPDGLTWTSRSLGSNLYWGSLVCSSTLLVISTSQSPSSTVVTSPLYTAYYSVAGVVASITAVGGTGGTWGLPRYKNPNATGDSLNTTLAIGHIAAYSAANFLTGSAIVRDASENLKLCVYRIGTWYGQGQHFGTGYDIYVTGFSTGSSLDEVTYSGTTYVIFKSTACCFLVPKG